MESAYMNLLRDIMANGEWQETRTGIRCKGVFGRQIRFDLSNGRFPLLTTKKVNFKAILHELLWFISGETNAGALIENSVRIWDEWTPAYKQGGKEEVARAFESNPRHELLDLGPVYGAQWRRFSSGKELYPNSADGAMWMENPNGVDQLKEVVERIKTNPECRRLIVSAWNPPLIPYMGLPPCHCLFQFRVIGAKLHLQMYQRSADVFLGVPFNIASYALLLRMVAAVTGYQAGEFVHTFGDVHIYENHVDQIKEQLSRQWTTPPAIAFNRVPDSLFDFKFEDIELIGYNPQPPIKAEVAV